MTRRTVLAIALVTLVALGTGCATMGLVESIESLLAQAKALLDAKKFDEALAKLAEVIRRDPTQWKAYLYGAQAYIGKLDWSAALGNIRKAYQLAPTDGSVLATLGETLFGAGRDALQRGAFADAVGHFVEYVKLRPTDVAGYLHAGRAYLGARDWNSALDNLRKAYQLAPTDGSVVATLTESLFGAGRDALQRGAFADAVDHFVEYVKLRPADAAGYLNAGRAYIGNRSWLDAGRVLVDGVGRAADPAVRREFGSTLLDGGRQALNSGDPKGAIAMLREYVKLEPADVNAYLNLGKAYVNSGDNLEALGAFRKVLELAPQNEEARRFLLGR
jgi:tetratricopeptide (TPR) repeat protein